MSSCHYSMIRVFQCEDTLTGILTGVYDAWDSRLGHENVRLQSGDHENLELFCEYEEVEPDLGKAEKVLGTIRTRLGEEAYEMIAYASAYPHAGKADAIYRMIVVGLHLPDGRMVSGMLTHPDVRLVFELRRKTWHMAHRYMGFVRFRELKNGVLFSEIEAEADVLALIAPHFADRLMMEDWAIYDRRRRKAAVHPAGKGWVILEDAKEAFSSLQESEAEPYFDRLWKIFHRALGIESRVNPGLQMSFLPRKFRPFMNEFADSETT
ncbi:MAG: TIGR03915 family putative DNA repair protein [Lachnospiraceae bacterium]|nr:TIGR03915 family putative DNA repair protein [Lachnospiraceae bacterium]